MEQDYDTKKWSRGCPNIDCRKEQSVCGIKYVNIPAALGDDQKDSEVAPKNGAYNNAIVHYEANGAIYLYSKEGIPVDVSAGDPEIEKEIRELIERVNELEEDKADKSEIPTKVSQLLNDSNFVTNTTDDLINYYTKTDIDDELNGYQEKIDSEHQLSADLVDDTDTVHKFVTAEEKADYAGKYNKPTTGIPLNDLSSSVQTSLGKADTALQEHQSIKTINEESLVGTGNITINTIPTAEEEAIRVFGTGNYNVITYSGAEGETWAANNSLVIDNVTRYRFFTTALPNAAIQYIRSTTRDFAIVDGCACISMGEGNNGTMTSGLGFNIANNSLVPYFFMNPANPITTADQFKLYLKQYPITVYYPKEPTS